MTPTHRRTGRLLFAVALACVLVLGTFAQQGAAEFSKMWLGKAQTIRIQRLE